MNLAKLAVLAALLFSPALTQASSLSLDAQSVRKFKGYSGTYLALAVSADGRYALTGDEAKNVALWDIQKGELIRLMKGHGDFVHGVAFSPDGKFALSGSWDKTLKLWHVSSGNLLKTIPADDKIFSVAFSKDGLRALSGGLHTVRVWDLKTGKALQSLEGHTAAVFSVSFTDDGRGAVTVGLDNQVNVWDLDSGKVVKSFVETGHWIIGDRISPDHKTLLLAGESPVKLIDLKSGKTIRTFANPMPDHGNMPVAFSPDGRAFILEGARSEYNLWETSTGKLLRTFQGSAALIGVSFTPDGRSILAAADAQPLMAIPANGEASAPVVEAAPLKPAPADVVSPEAVTLGKILFFDPRLSHDRTVSCSSCHSPNKGWADDKAFSKGVGGKVGRRNSQSIVNASLHNAFMWDGRAATLEEQAKLPIENPEEMGTTTAQAEKAIAAIPGYSPYFKSAFGDSKVTFERIAKAISAFEKSLVSKDSPYDRYQVGDAHALNDAELRGLKLFNGKGNCFMCHQPPSFTNVDFQNIGVGKGGKDAGRFEVTKDERDRGSFRVPDLHNLRYTAPYMHDGSLATLEDVVDYYNKGGRNNSNLSFKMAPLNLTAQEQTDIIKFLGALNGDPHQLAAPGKLPE